MIKLFWFSNPLMQRGPVLNFGDELSRDIVKKLSGKKVKWFDPTSQNFIQRNFTSHVLGIGSILHFGAKNSIIWGSGLIDSKAGAPDANYLAVRGKYTRNELSKRGYNVPKVYGDPGLLTSKLFPDKIKSKKYKIGIIPHYSEFHEVNGWFIKNNFSEEFCLIDLRKDNSTVINQILSCESIVSSSLHGIIVPQSYNIPSFRVSFTDNIIGDGIKYHDYFDSVGIKNYEFFKFDAHSFTDLALIRYVEQLKHFGRINNNLIKMQDDLIAVKPF